MVTRGEVDGWIGEIGEGDEKRICCEHRVRERIADSLYCTPETDRMHVNCIGIKTKNTWKDTGGLYQPLASWWSRAFQGSDGGRVRRGADGQGTLSLLLAATTATHSSGRNLRFCFKAQIKGSPFIKAPSHLPSMPALLWVKLPFLFHGSEQADALSLGLGILPGTLRDFAGNQGYDSPELRTGSF